MSISQTICDFATLAIEAGGWMEMDRLYLQNRLLGMVGEDALESIEVRPVKEESVDLLISLSLRQENGVLSELPAEQEIFEAQLMDFHTATFSRQCILCTALFESPEEATEYFFNLSKKNDYIKTRAIAKTSNFRQSRSMVNWKSQSIYLSQKKIQNKSQQNARR